MPEIDGEMIFPAAFEVPIIAHLEPAVAFVPTQPALSV